MEPKLVTFEMIGMKELLYALKVFPLEFKEKVAKQSCRAASSVIKNYAVSLAPTRARGWEGWGKRQYPPGNLKRNIKVWRARDTLNEVGYWVGVYGRGPAWYGRLVETGHAKVVPAPRSEWTPRTGQYVTRGRRTFYGKHVGHVPAHPWLRPALEAAARRAVEASREKIAKELGKAVKNAGR